MPGTDAIRYEVPRGRGVPGSNGDGESEGPIELRFEGRDIMNLRSIVEGTGLAMMGFHRVFRTLEACAEHSVGEAATGVLGASGHGGRITMAGFRTALRELVPKERLVASGVDSLGVSQHLQAMHLLFSRGLADPDRQGAEGLTADVDELACGFAVLCGGRKSSKLEGMFEIMDADRDGRLNRREMWRLGRATLLAFFSCRERVVDTVLLAARSVQGSGEARQSIRRLLDACDDCAVSMAVAVHDRAASEGGAGGGPRKGRAVSFDQFAAWYNFAGFESHSFLELLNLQKWPGMEGLHTRGDDEEAGEAELGGGEDDEEEGMEDDEDEDDEEEDYGGISAESAAPPGLRSRPPPGPPTLEGDEMAAGAAEGPPGLSGIAPPTLPARSSGSGVEPSGAASAAVASVWNEADDVDWLQFPLGDGDAEAQEDGSTYVLTVQSGDVRKLLELLVATGLHEVPCGTVAEAVLERAGADGTVDREAFLALLNDVVDFDEVDAEIRDTMRLRLMTIFYAFDSFETDVVNAPELLAALALLSSGPKSDKLAMLWEAFADADEAASAREEGRGPSLKMARVLRLLRSVLTAVASLCAVHSNAETEDLSSLVDAGALRATVELFQGTTGQRQLRDAITFHEFAEWYNREGMARHTWVELLNHRKWPFEASGGDGGTLGTVLDSLDSDSAAGGYDPDAVADDEEEGMEADEGDEESIEDDGLDGDVPVAEASLDSAPDAIVFTLQMTLSGNQLELTRGDCDYVQRLAAVSRLPTAAPAVANEIMRAAQWEGPAPGRLNFAQFLRALVELAPFDPDNVSDDEQNLITGFARDAFDCVQAAYMDGGQSEQVVARQTVHAEALAASILLLCSGDKSSKLSTCWRLFYEASILRAEAGEEVQPPGTFPAGSCPAGVTLSLTRLRDFLCAMLAGVTSVQLRSDPMDVAHRGAIIRRSANQIASMIGNGSEERGFGSARFDDGARLSFAAFGEFYNRCAPDALLEWMELLDLRKWPPATQFEAGLDGDDEDEDASAEAVAARRQALEQLHRELNEGADDDEQAARLNETESLDGVGAADARDADDAADDDEDDEEQGVDRGAPLWAAPAFGFALLPRPDEMRPALIEALRTAAEARAEATGRAGRVSYAVDDVVSAAAAAAPGCSVAGGGVSSRGIVVTLADCARLDTLRTAGSLDSITVEAVHELVGGERHLRRARYEEIVRRIRKGAQEAQGNSTLSHRRGHWFQRCMSQLFDFADREGTGIVASDEFAVQLCMLAAGGKSEKIAACWRRFSEREAGAASPDVRAAAARGAGADGMEDLGRLGKLGLWRLMRSVLSAMAGVLVCAQHDGEEDEPEDRVQREVAEGPAQLLPHRARRLNVEQTGALQTKIDLAALSVAESVLRSTGHAGEEDEDGGVLSDDGVGVDYDEFSEWYNGGGRAEAPYLEMLDLGKWPSAGFSVGDEAAEEERDDVPGLRVAASGAGADEEEDYEGEEEAEPQLPESVRKFDPFAPGSIIFSTPLARQGRGTGPTSTVVFGPTAFTIREGDLGSLACLLELTRLGTAQGSHIAALAIACSPAAQRASPESPGDRGSVRSAIGDALRSSTGGAVEKSSYNQALRSALDLLAPEWQGWSDQESSFVSFKMSHFFWMFHLQHRFVDDAEIATRAGDLANTPEERAEIMRELNDAREEEEDSSAGQAPILALATGLVVLGKGAKSEKLAAAWRMFAGQHPVLRDQDEEDREAETGEYDEPESARDAVGYETNDTGSLALTRAELFNLLRALLTGLLALDRVSSSQPDVDVRIAVAEAASRMAEEAFHEGELLPPGDDSGRGTLARITFNSFAQFYNTFGHRQLSWLELLDLRKWVTPSNNGKRLAAALGLSGQPDDEDDEEDDGMDGEEEEEEQEDEDRAADAEPENRPEPERTENAHDEDDEVAFGFQLTEGGERLAISAGSVREFLSVADATSLAEQEAEEVLRAFAMAAKDGELDRSGFSQCLRMLVPVDRLDGEPRAATEFALMRLFDAFDADHNGTVDFAEFAAGFTLLAAGSKQEKLRLAFRLFDANGDGYISEDEMQAYLRSFLLAIAVFSEHGASHRTSRQEIAALRDRIAEAAQRVAQVMVEEADTNRDGHVSWEEFCEWYDMGGHAVAPWIELLNVRKWAVQPRGEEAADAAKDAEEQDEGDADEEQGDDAVLFRIQVRKGSSAASPSNQFVMHQEDADRLMVLQRTSRLPITSPEEVHRLVVGQTPANSERVDRTGLASVVQQLIISGRMASLEEKNAVEETVMRVWTSVADVYEGEETAPWKELAAAFGMLSWGSKSEKLGAAWRLFEDDEGRMGVDALSDFLRSQLGSLVALSSDVPRPTTSQGAREPAAEVASDLVRASVASAARDLAQRCCDDLTGGDEEYDGVDFGEFGEWFNQGGRQEMPWLEVLDLVKWPGLADELRFIHDEMEEEIMAEDEDADVDDGEDDEQDVEDAGDGDATGAAGQPEDGDDYVDRLDSVDPLVVTVPFLPGVANERRSPEDEGARSVLSFRRSDAERAIRASRDSGMSQRTPAEVFDVVESAVSFGVLQQSGLDQIVRELTSFQDEDEDDRASADEGIEEARAVIRQMLNQLRLALHAHALSPHQTACALLPLCAGTKSDKLAVAFKRISEGASGRLTHAQLWQLLLSMAAGLRGLRADRGEPGESNLTHSSVRDEMASLAVDIVREAAGGATDAMDVSFDDFGQWFNSAGGRDRVVWIDLQDMRKWPGATEIGFGTAPQEQAAFERASEQAWSNDVPPPSTMFDFELRSASDASSAEGVGAGGGEHLLITRPDCARMQHARQQGGATKQHPLAFQKALVDAAADAEPIELSNGRPGVQASTILVALAMLRTGQDAVAARQFLREEDASFREVEQEDSEMLQAGQSDPNAAVEAGRRLVSVGRIQRGKELIMLVSGIVKALDIDGVGAAPLAAASVAASLFVGGSKSVKLGFGFTSVAGYTGEELGPDGYTDDEEEELDPMVRAHKRASRFVVDRMDLSEVLAAVLVGLLVSTRQARSSSCLEVRELSDDTAMQLVNRIADFAAEKDEAGGGGDGPGGLTFLRLGDWYNSGGHSQMSWVELLDPEKWPNVLDDGESGAAEQAEGDGDYEEDYEEEDGDGAGGYEAQGGGQLEGTPDDSGFVDEEEEGLARDEDDDEDGDSLGAAGGDDDVDEALLKAAESEAEQQEYERAAASGAGADPSDDAEDAEDGVDEDDEDDLDGGMPSASPSALLFSFQTHVRRPTAGDAEEATDAPVVTIRERDRQYLEQIATLTGLASAGPTDVLDAVGFAAASEGQLGPSQLHRSIKILQDGKQGVAALQEEQDLVSMYLNQLHMLLEDAREGTCSVAEAATALMLPAAASKSEKLSLAFDLFAVPLDEGADEEARITVVTQQGLEGVFRSLLASLLSFHDDSSTRKTSDVRADVDEAAEAIAMDAMEHSGEEADLGQGPVQVLSMDSLSKWYNDGGFTVVPWFELLSRSKWSI